MRHRVYRTTHGVSFMGFKPEDFVVLLLSVSLGLNVLGALFPGRWRLIFAVAFVFIGFRGWRRVRDKVPDKFLAHLGLWLSEPEVYRVGRDMEPVPLVVDPQAVRRSRGG